MTDNPKTKKKPVEKKHMDKKPSKDEVDLSEWLAGESAKDHKNPDNSHTKGTYDDGEAALAAWLTGDGDPKEFLHEWVNGDHLKNLTDQFNFFKKKHGERALFEKKRMVEQEFEIFLKKFEEEDKDHLRSLFGEWKKDLIPMRFRKILELHQNLKIISEAGYLPKEKVDTYLPTIEFVRSRITTGDYESVPKTLDLLENKMPETALGGIIPYLEKIAKRQKVGVRLEKKINLVEILGKTPSSVLAQKFLNYVRKSETGISLDIIEKIVTPEQLETFLEKIGISKDILEQYSTSAAAEMGDARELMSKLAKREEDVEKREKELEDLANMKEDILLEKERIQKQRDDLTLRTSKGGKEIESMKTSIQRMKKEYEDKLVEIKEKEDFLKSVVGNADFTKGVTEEERAHIILAAKEYEESRNRASTGQGVIDKIMLDGGLLYGTNALLVGEPFSPKGHIIINFIDAGLRRETPTPAIVILTDRLPDTIKSDLMSIGNAKHDEYLEKGAIRYITLYSEFETGEKIDNEENKIFINFEEKQEKLEELLIKELRDVIKDVKKEGNEEYRVVVDQLSGIKRMILDKSSFDKFVRFLTGTVNRDNAVALYSIDELDGKTRRIYSEGGKMDYEFSFRSEGKGGNRKNFLDVHGRPNCPVKTNTIQYDDKGQLKQLRETGEKRIGGKRL